MTPSSALALTLELVPSSLSPALMLASSSVTVLFTAMVLFLVVRTLVSRWFTKGGGQKIGVKTHSSSLHGRLGHENLRQVACM